MNATSKLGAAIKRYRAGGELDCNVEKLLQRLEESPVAHEVFSRIAGKDRAARGILDSCVETEQHARTFPDRMKAIKKEIKELDDAQIAIQNLESFLKRAVEKPAKNDLLSAAVWMSSPDLDRARDGLYVIERLIEMRRRVAGQTFPRLGATRKKNPAAIQQAALGWLGEGVKRATGRPNRPSVAILAEVIFGPSDQTEDRVWRGLRNREKRDWRA